MFRFSPALDLLPIGDGELSFSAQVKPGLSSYKDNPVRAQDGIDVFLANGVGSRVGW